MNYCSDCGAKLETDKKECPRCGRSIKTTYVISCKNRNSYLRAGFLGVILGFFLLDPVVGTLNQALEDPLQISKGELYVSIGVSLITLLVWTVSFILVHAALVLTERTVTSQ
jgi:DNA-directed RNA polymerase subunit RPC12/RpoP